MKISIDESIRFIKGRAIIRLPSELLEQFGGASGLGGCALGFDFG